MFDAVFISDLHLHPHEAAIMTRFHTFINWAARQTRAVYILGDFLHVWPGDEAMDAWSDAIADRLAWLSAQGVALYFMPGNRDFLLGERFMQRAKLHPLREPSIITLGGERVLLVHGDRYCTRDKSHQWLRFVTRNRMFPIVFSWLPYRLRANIVTQVRQHSQTNRQKTLQQMDVVPATMQAHLHALDVKRVIHGHIHKPGVTTYIDESRRCEYHQYVLSDWDDSPQILCYDNTHGYKFIQIMKG